MVTIYGKDSCPYTQAARDDYARRGIAFEYINVKKDAGQLQHMLTLSKGRRAGSGHRRQRYGDDRLWRDVRGLAAACAAVAIL
jgi:glutaredoxin-related protein